MSRAETYRFVVTTNMPSDEPARHINAAYFQHDDRFTVFKAEDGGIVASFANDHIVGIERETTSVSN